MYEGSNFAAEYISVPDMESGGPPQVFCFQSPNDRARAFENICKSFPGTRFAMADVTEMAEIAPGPLKRFSVDERGVLPK